MRPPATAGRYVFADGTDLLYAISPDRFVVVDTNPLTTSHRSHCSIKQRDQATLDDQNDGRRQDETTIALNIALTPVGSDRSGGQQTAFDASKMSRTSSFALAGGYSLVRANASSGERGCFTMERGNSTSVAGWELPGSSAPVMLRTSVRWDRTSRSQRSWEARLQLPPMNVVSVRSCPSELMFEA